MVKRATGTVREGKKRGRLRPDLAYAALVCFVGLVGVWGCSSSSPSRPCGGACAAGTACIDDKSGGGPSCKKVCTAQAQCPFNTYCNDGAALGLSANFCAPSTYPVRKETKQWGSFCHPSGGGRNNSDCDTADYFECYGTSPTDANAFCTISDCTLDGDCPGGWWCATKNVAPNVLTAKPTFDATQTHNVCLPRQYCDPCRADHDCPLAPDGTQQHCVPDTQGAGYCAPQCANADNCPTGDATCTVQWSVCAQVSCAANADCEARSAGETCVAGVCRSACSHDIDCPRSNGVVQHCSSAGVCAPPACASDDDCPPTATAYQHCNAGVCVPECGADSDCNPAAHDQHCVSLSVCTPRAGACVGDGSFCSPCRSDLDCACAADAGCAGGYCLVSKYSKERFCSQNVVGGVCSPTAGPPAGGCPTHASTENWKGVACTFGSDDFSPVNQCIGEVTFGVDSTGQPQFVPGCWTTNR